MNQNRLLVTVSKIKYFLTFFLAVTSFLDSTSQCTSIPQPLLQNKDYLVDIGKIKQQGDSLFVPVVVTNPSRRPDSSTYILSVYTPDDNKLIPVISDSFLYMHDYVVNTGTITILGNKLHSDSVNNQIVVTHHFGHYKYEKTVGGYSLKKFTPLFHEHDSFFDSLGFVGVIDILNVQHYYKSANGDSLAVPIATSSIKKLFPFELNRAIVADQNNLFHLFHYNEFGSLQQEVANASYIKVNSNFTVFAKFPDGSIRLIKLNKAFPYGSIAKSDYQSGYNFIDNSSKHAIVRKENKWYAVDSNLNEIHLPADVPISLPLPKLFLQNSTSAYVFDFSQPAAENSYLVLDLEDTSDIKIETINSKQPLLPYLYLMKHQFVFMRPTNTELTFVPYVNQQEKPVTKTIAGNFLKMTVIQLNSTRTGAVIVYEKNNKSRADIIIRYGGSPGNISSKMYNELFDKWWISHNNRFLITSKRKSNLLVETYGYDLNSLIPSNAVSPKHIGGTSAKLINLFFADPCDPCTFYYKLDSYNRGQSIELYKEDGCKHLNNLTVTNMLNKNKKNPSNNIR